MIDKNGVEIKRGKFCRYEGRIMKVLFAGSGKMVVADDETKEVLNVQPECLKHRILNIEIIASYPY